MKKAKASITLYLALVLVIIMTLICTLVESGRVSAINMKLRGITYMAMDSMFSGYARELFDEYGVMFLWTGEEDFLTEFDEYLEDNLNTTGLGITRKADLYGMAHVSSEIQEIKWATDDGGELFGEQVSEYMKYYLIENAAEKILENTGIFEQGGKVSEFMEKIRSYKDVFERVENAVGEINQFVEQMKKATENPKELLEKMLDYIDKYINTGDPSFTLEYSSYYSKLKSNKIILESYLRTIRDKTEEYYWFVEDAKEAVGELQSQLDEDAAEYEPEIYEIVEEQVEDIRQKSADTDFDYYKVGENENMTYVYEEKISRLDGFFEEVGYTLDKENAESLREGVSKYLEEFSGFNLDDLKLNFEVNEVEKEDDSFLDSINDLFENGILEFVAGEVSEKSVDRSAFPSVTSMQSHSETEENLAEAALDKALFSEYLNSHFGRFTSPKEDTALEYEAEYVLGGKDSDKDNLSTVVTEIVLLRTGCNLISLLKDSKKKAETFELATALVGFTGMPIVVKIVQIVIIAAWALAESMLDARALLRGDKVVTIKGGDDWYLSLEGIKNFSADSASDSDSDKGLTYEDYLRLLFLMQNRQTQYYRTMDMIQANLCLNENQAFRMKDCIAAARISVNYKAGRLFAGIPSAQGGNAYRIVINQQYKY